MDFASALEEAIAHTNSGRACRLLWEFRIISPGRWGSRVEILCESQTQKLTKVVSLPVIIQGRINILVAEIDAMTNALLPH